MNLIPAQVAYVPTGGTFETTFNAEFGALPRVGEILELVRGFPGVAAADRRLVVTEVIHTLDEPQKLPTVVNWLLLIRCRPAPDPTDAVD